MKESFEREAAKWDKRLAAEGMPAELPLVGVEAEYSPAFEEGIRDLGLYFIEHPRAQHYAHREKVIEVQSRMKAAGASDEEMELLSEDFVRNVEDTIDSIQLAAQTHVQDLIEANPASASRPDMLTRIVFAKLKKESPPMVSKEVLEIAAMRAVETIARAS